MAVQETDFTLKNFREKSLCYFSITNFKAHGGGGTQHIRIGGDSVQEISGNPEISVQLHCKPKVTAHSLEVYT